MNDTGKLIAIVLLASFAIERIVAAVDFFLVPMPPAERNRHLMLAGVAGVIGAAVVALSGIRILALLKMGSPVYGLDAFLTWLVLVGGADRIRELLGQDDGDSKKIPPIQLLIADREGNVTVQQTTRPY